MLRRIFRTTISVSLLALGGAGVGVQMGAADFEAPPVTFPTIVDTAATAEGFVPRGWTLVDRKSGDLNGDKRDDIALLLRMADKANVVAIPNGDPGETWDTNPFLLVVAFAEPNGGYRLVTNTHRLFDRPDVPYDGSPPPDKDSVRIERGSLVIFTEYLRNWDRQRFRWDGEKFRLIGHDAGGASGACTETESINYLTGRVTWKLEPIEGKGQATGTARTRPVDLPTLDTFDKNAFIAFETIDGKPPPCPAQ